MFETSKYIYDICKGCKGAECCLMEGGITLTASDIIRYATALDITVKEFLLTYTVDRFEDLSWDKAYEYLLDYNDDMEQAITFLARREPYFNRLSYCIFALFDKKSGSIRCATYNCRSSSCREFYADGCMCNNSMATEHYVRALDKEKLIEPFFQNNTWRPYVDYAKSIVEYRKEFKKGINNFAKYDLSKYQLPIETKLQYVLNKSLGSKIEDSTKKSLMITDNKMLTYPKDINCIKGKCNKSKFSNVTNPNIQEAVHIQPVREKFEVNPDKSSKSQYALYKGLRFIDSLVTYFPYYTNADDRVENMCEVFYLVNMVKITSYDKNVSRYASIILDKLSKQIKDHISKYGIYENEKNKVEIICDSFCIPYALKYSNFKDISITNKDIHCEISKSLKKANSLFKNFNPESFDLCTDTLVQVHSANLLDNDKYLKDLRGIIKKLDSILFNKDGSFNHTKKIDAFYTVTHICLTSSYYSLKPLDSSYMKYINWLKKSVVNFKNDTESFAEYLECCTMLGIRDEQFEEYANSLIEKQNCDGSWSGIPSKKESFSDMVYRTYHSTFTAIDALRETKAYHNSKKF